MAGGNFRHIMKTHLKSPKFGTIQLMLLDEVDITFEGGRGGDGKVAFFPGKQAGPSGGNGGRGGNLYVDGTRDLTALNQFSTKKFIKAENGIPGGINKLIGRDGEDLIIKLPIGSSLTLKNGPTLDILRENDPIIICRGGKGGKGNWEFRSSTNTTPLYAQSGKDGEKKEFHINLRLLADFGLIGLPNAGKSSLLNELTRANVKVAGYAFTTLEPNLGVMDKKVLADIPGLIEGASIGKGLGIKFLKHIEKVEILLHCISAESLDPIQDYELIREELGNFNKELLDKKEIILVTKTDTVDQTTLDEKIKKLQKTKKEIIPVSIHDLESLENLKNKLLG